MGHAALTTLFDDLEREAAALLAADLAAGMTQAQAERAAYIRAVAGHEKADAKLRATCLAAGFTAEDIEELNACIADAYGFIADTGVH